MTSKEALEELQCVLVSNQATKRYSDIFEENLLRPIEKDLEVLEKYRKIEKEIGIDLITLFKALKKGVYVKFDSYFGNIGELDIKIVKDNATGICYRNKKWYIQEEDTLIKDYGKTWALTKEELEDD